MKMKKFFGYYRENFANGTDKLIYGMYILEELKTRVKISFRPTSAEGLKEPLFRNFVVLGNMQKALDYIDRNWH